MNGRCEEALDPQWRCAINTADRSWILSEIRRMTKSCVNLFDRALQSANTSARLSERIRRCPGGSAFRPLPRNHQFPRRRILMLQQHLTRLSRQATDTSSSSELEHFETASGATVLGARDLARTDLDLLLNLVRSESPPTSEASSRHHPFPTRQSRCRHQANASSNHHGEDTKYLRIRCVPRTVKQSCPHTK